MSAVYHSAVEALNNDPELAARVMSVNTAEERAAILREAGVDVPTHDDVNSAHNDLAGVSGGSGTGATTFAGTTAAPAAASAAAM